MTRVLKPGGVIVWVVGDATIGGSETGTSFRQALFFKDVCGLNLHDTMIYDKGSCPYPDKTRYYSSFEYMFVFSKGRPKTFNPIRDRPNKEAGKKIMGTTTRRPDGSLIKTSAEINNTGRTIKEFGVRWNIWRYSPGFGKSHTDNIAYKHPATFPEALVRDLMISWSNPGDIIYDCCGGSGTVAKIAKLNNRNWILSEISSEYCEIIQERLELVYGTNNTNFINSIV